MNTAKILQLSMLVSCLGAAPALGQGPQLSPTQLLPGDRLIGPASGEQQAPAAARGGDKILAVWEDSRTDPYSSRYTNYGGYDIYAARLDAGGQLIDRIPIAVNQDAADQTDPRVAWNGTHWLVVWNSRVPTQFFYTDAIHAARVSPDGELLDATPILLHTMPGSSNGELWGVASDGFGWTVFWKDYVGSTWQVQAARVDATGVLLDPEPVNVFAVPASQPYNGDVAYAGDEYLVVWNNWTSAGRDNIFGRRLSPLLARLGNQFTIARSTDYDVWPSVATDGDAFFVAWENYNTCCVGGGGKVFAARVTHDGQVLDQNGLLLSQTTAVSTGRRPAACWDGAEWFATWTYPAQSLGDLMIYGGRVTTAGVRLDPGGFQVAPSNARQEEAALVSAPDGGAVALWTDSRAGGFNPKDIYTAAVSAGGQASPAAPISLGVPAQIEPDLAANGNGYLAVFTSRTSGGARIVGQRLDRFGTAIDAEPFEIAPFGALVRLPEVAFDGSVYLVVWEDGGAIQGRRVDTAGNPIDPAPFPIMPGITPDVAAIPGSFLVVGTDTPSSVQIRLTFGARVRASDGTVLDPNPRLIGQNHARNPQVTAVGNRWCAAWQRHPTHDNPRAEILARFVEGDGTMSTTLSVQSSSSRYYATVASDGDAVLVAWQDGTSSVSDILGRRILGSGVLGSTVTISAAANRQSLAALGWDGTRYVSAFEDLRNITFFVDDRKDVYGARISATGTVIDPGGFAIATAAQPEITPSVAGEAGSAVMAFATMQPDEPFAAYRIGVRVMEPPACAGSVASYGIGCAGTGGIVPVHAVRGCPSSGNVVTLALDDAVGGTVGALLFGNQRGAVSLGGGCQVLVAPALATLSGLPVTGIRAGGGSLEIPVTVPAVAGTLQLTTQFFVLDAGAPMGLSASNGVETTFR